MSFGPLPREFYLRDTLDVARDLLGKELVHYSECGVTSGIIVEVEAYIGPDDPASHAYRGLRSKRTWIQYQLGGRAYVYRIYGLYHCFNVVTERENSPEVILIRAIQPMTGVKLMRLRRRLKGDDSLVKLTNGPGKLCQAMGIDLNCYGADLCGNELFIKEPEVSIHKKICTSKRINIDYAGYGKNFAWRFFLKDNLFVSNV